SNLNGSSSPSSVNQTINQADSSVAVASSANPSAFGQAVVFTATVSAVAPGSGTPTGNVVFHVSGRPDVTAALNASGTATATFSNLAFGNHSVAADYNGSTNFKVSTGTLAGGQNVTAASTSTAVTSSANPSVFSQPVTFTAIVSAVSPGQGT